MENNYLSHEQERTKQQQLAGCINAFCEIKTEMQWLLVSSGQNASFASGAVAGIPEALFESVTGLVEMLAHPVDTFNAIKEIIQHDDTLGLITDSLKQDYLQRLDTYLTEYEKAGATGSFNAGREAGKLLTDAASILAGGAGIAKGGVVLSHKITKIVKTGIGKGENPLSVANIAKGSQAGAVNAGKGTTGNKVVNSIDTQASVNKKLDTYLLEKNHPVGGSKAEWFDQALGFNKANSGQLSKQIVFDSNSAIQTGVTEFGTKYDQVIKITGANGRQIDVKFGWIKNNDGVVRLVTAIPAKK